MFTFELKRGEERTLLHNRYIVKEITRTTMISLRLFGRFSFRNKFPVPVRTTSTASTTLPDEAITSDVKPFSDIPGPRGLYNIPFIGSAFHFKPFTEYETSDIVQVLTNGRDKYGDIFKIKLGKAYSVVISHPHLAKAVLQLPYKDHHRQNMDLFEIYHKRTKVPKDLATLHGNEWLSLRKPSQEKMLKPAVVASYIPLIEQVTNDFIVYLREKDTVDDMLYELMNFTTESVGMLCYNKRLHCLGNNSNTEFIQVVQDMFSTFQTAAFMPIKTFKYFRTDLYKKFEHAKLEIKRISDEHIADQRQRLKRLEDEGRLDEYLTREPNFLHSLLADSRLTDSDISGIVSSLFAGGIDSTANSMTFVLINLALHPEKQDKLYKEINRVVGESTTMTKDHLNELPFLKACIKESFRTYFPVLLGPPRITEHDTQLGGFMIPKKTHVIINMNAMSMDERFYPHPSQYIPERWLRKTEDPIAKGLDFPFALKPFGFGPRGCVGQRFAEMELYIGITKIIQNFQVSLPTGVTQVKSMPQTFTTPAERVVIHLKDRRKFAKK